MLLGSIYQFYLSKDISYAGSEFTIRQFDRIDESQFFLNWVSILLIYRDRPHWDDQFEP